MEIMISHAFNPGKKFKNSSTETVDGTTVGFAGALLNSERRYDVWGTILAS